MHDQQRGIYMKLMNYLQQLCKDGSVARYGFRLICNYEQPSTRVFEDQQQLVFIGVIIRSAGSDFADRELALPG